MNLATIDIVEWLYLNRSDKNLLKNKLQVRLQNKDGGAK